MPAVNAIPGLKRLPKPGGCFTWYWSASQIARDSGNFRPRTFRLWHGVGEPSANELVEIQQRCDALTFDLREWQLRSKRQRRKIEGGRVYSRKRGFIYVIRAGERVKVGFSRNVERRLREMQTHSPDDLELVLAVAGSPVLEHELHARFGDLSLRGEWFRYEQPIRDFVAAEQARNRP